MIGRLILFAVTLILFATAITSIGTANAGRETQRAALPGIRQPISRRATSVDRRTKSPRHHALYAKRTEKYDGVPPRRGRCGEIFAQAIASAWPMVGSRFRLETAFGRFPPYGRGVAPAELAARLCAQIQT